MYRDILTNKWVLSGAGFLIVFAVGCVLWYQHGTADERKAAADAEKLLRQAEIAKKVSDTNSVVEQAADVVSVESNTPTADKPITQTTPAPQTIEPTHMQTDAPVQATGVAADTPVSPFGFGPYPEVPDGLKAKKFVPSWSNHNWETNPKKKWELFDRVLIKAWNDGQHWNGAIMDYASGKVHLNVPGVVHVWYGYNTNPVDGTTHRYFTRVSGANLTPEQMQSGILPEGLTSIDGEIAGIDPYEYLGISR